MNTPSLAAEPLRDKHELHTIFETVAAEGGQVILGQKEQMQQPSAAGWPKAPAHRGHPRDRQDYLAKVLARAGMQMA